MKMLIWAVLGAAFFAPGSASAQAPAENSRSIQLSKIIFNPDIAKENQRIRVGTICLFSGGPLNFGSTDRTLDVERFERLFASTMKEKRLNVVARASALFDDAEPEADFLIGGTLRLKAITLCDSVNGQKGNLTLAVEWQLYDRKRREVVETVTTEGSARVEKFDRDGLNTMLNSGFSQSVTALIDHGALQKHLGAATPPSLQASPASGSTQ
jgi:hypothetical protein